MTHFPTVQGRCPACTRSTLILGAGGYVTCAHLECPDPTAASNLLEQHPAQQSAELEHYRRTVALIGELCRRIRVQSDHAPDDYRLGHNHAAGRVVRLLQRAEQRLTITMGQHR
ncbi:hypothetical protein ABH930_000292 [Kitasatospora sp. GAS204A]|uniref:DUF6085 family protein n=1 Tax=unclassified Kitasatospora TaxID=2633591 RepID=UPI0024743679|nr:DUF6085 family protein [Kitasatospora sp. GAS204B]MDH6116873.1 hypothetical protein [Kitasatospora sp. GAS204B]